MPLLLRSINELTYCFHYQSYWFKYSTSKCKSMADEINCDATAWYRVSLRFSSALSSAKLFFFLLSASNNGWVCFWHISPELEVIRRLNWLFVVHLDANASLLFLYHKLVNLRSNSTQLQTFFWLIKTRIGLYLERDLFGNLLAPCHSHIRILCE